MLVTAGDTRYLVAALRAVDGVADAAVEPDEDDQGGGVLRLRLVEGADDAAVTTEVNRLLRTTFRLALDAERVQVAHRRETIGARVPGHLRPAPDPAPETTEAGARKRTSHRAVAASRRLSIERAQTISQDLSVVASITLGLDGRVFTGEAEGAATNSSIHRAIALATLRAVEAAVEVRARFELDLVEISIGSGEQTALSVVTMVTRRGSDRLSGASVVREDVRQAVIRSVLAAVNRSLSDLLDPS